MILAAINDGLYNVFYLAHLLAAIVGAGAAFTLPVVAVRLRRGNELAAVAAMYETSRILVTPAFLLSGLLGAGLVGLSGGSYEFSQGWLGAAFAVWIMLLVVGFALLWPLEKRAAQACRQNDIAELATLTGRIGMFQGIGHLAILAMLVIMVWGSSFSF